MKGHVMTEAGIKRYLAHLRREERSEGTIRRYAGILRRFLDALPEDRTVNREVVLDWKARLGRQYAVTTANLMLSAARGFFKFEGWTDCCVRQFRRQKRMFRAASREMSIDEYQRLLQTARERENERLFHIIMTLGSTGMRISELSAVTVESLDTRYARVIGKGGKYRPVYLPAKLVSALREYCAGHGIESGPIFVTRGGKPVDRSNVAHELKKLAEAAGIDPGKAFPHNLRHLFAVTHYHAYRDIVQLSGILGHSNVETTRVYTLESSKEGERQLDSLPLTMEYHADLPQNTDSVVISASENSGQHGAALSLPLS